MTVPTPIESRTRGVPGWALGLTGAMLLAGALFFATNLKGSNPPIIGTPEPSGSGGGLNAQTSWHFCLGNVWGNRMKGMTEGGYGRVLPRYLDAPVGEFVRPLRTRALRTTSSRYGPS